MKRVMNRFQNMTKRQLSGARTVLGGFFIHLVLGSLYIWANITDAVTSYLRIYQPSLTYSDTLVVFAVSLAGQGMSMFCGGLMSGYIGCQYTCLIGGYMYVMIHLHHHHHHHAIMSHHNIIIIHHHYISTSANNATVLLTPLHLVLFSGRFSLAPALPFPL